MKSFSRVLPRGRDLFEESNLQPDTFSLQTLDARQTANSQYPLEPARAEAPRNSASIEAAASSSSRRLGSGSLENPAAPPLHSPLYEIRPLSHAPLIRGHAIASYNIDTLFPKLQKQGKIEIESSVTKWRKIWQGVQEGISRLIRFWI